MSQGWIGVDFDGTLAMHIENKPYDPAKLGEPVPAMLERVKAWLAEGKDVRIFTARVADTNGGYRRGAEVLEAGQAISKWCDTHLGRRIPITCVKDQGMLELWDDRAVQVVRNAGKSIEQHMGEHLERATAEVRRLQALLDAHEEQAVDDGWPFGRGQDTSQR